MKTIRKIVVILSALLLNAFVATAQLGPLPGDPLPGDPDPGIEVPLDGEVLLGLLIVSGILVSLVKKKKNIKKSML